MSNAVYVPSENGRLVDPFDIKPGDFSLASTAHSLSQINRYSGATRVPLSVATHSVCLSLAVPKHLQRAAIIHDMPEMLVGDQARPIKRRNPQFVELEEECQRQFFALLGEPWESFEELAEYDTRICGDEMLQYTSYVPAIEPLGIFIPEWTPTEAALHFFDRALELGVPAYA